MGGEAYRTIQTLALLKALAEPVRIRIYLLLKKSALTVSELSEILGLSQSNTSHHIKALRDLGLLSAEKTGQHTYYGLESGALAAQPVQKLLVNLGDLASEIRETQSDATRLKAVLAARSEDTFALWRLEQPDLPYTDIFAHLAAGRQGHVVDVGCGAGDFFASLCLSFGRVTAIDIEPAHLFKAVAHTAQQVALVAGDAQALPLAAGVADAVVFRMALSQIPDPVAALGEALRVLKPRGFLSIIDGEKKSGDDLERRVREYLRTRKDAELDYERTLPRLFMLRVRKVSL